MPEALYLYGVLPYTRDIAFIRGLDDENMLRLHHKYKLSAVVSAVDPAAFNRGDDLQLMQYMIRHDSIISQLMRDHTILPMSFGTIVPDEDGLGTLLAQNAPRWQQVLAKVNGCVELGLKAYIRQDVLLRQISVGGAASTTASNYLQQKKTERDDKQRAQNHANAVLGQLHTACLSFARDGLLKPIQQPSMSAEGLLSLRGIYLLEKHRVDYFGDYVGEQIDFHRAWLTVIADGPFAPYHFVGEAADDSTR